MRQYTPFHNHNKARTHAKALRGKLERQHYELVQHKGIPLRDADVLLRAVDAVLSGRRVLMYTHVFAYYCTNKAELALFEHMQEQLNVNNERVLENLELREDVQEYLDMASPEQKRLELFAYITELRNYTELSLKFMREMLGAVEGGLLDDAGSAHAGAAGGGGSGGFSAAIAPVRRWLGASKAPPTRGGRGARAKRATGMGGASADSAADVEAERETLVARLLSLGHERRNAEAALRATFGDLAAAEQLLT